MTNFLKNELLATPLDEPVQVPDLKVLAFRLASVLLAAAALAALVR